LSDTLNSNGQNIFGVKLGPIDYNSARNKTKTKAKRKQKRNQRKRVRTMNRQGPLSDLIDMGAGAVKGIGRNLPIIGGLFKNAMTVSAPSAVGVVLPQATFNFIGRPQPTADYDTTRGVRISGGGLFTYTLVSTHTASTVTVIPDIPVFINSVGQTFYYVPIVPQNVDPRLAEITATFQFYAFRAIDFIYVPAVGTQTPTQLVLSVSQDAEEYLQIPSPFQTQALEMNTAMFTPAWQTNSMRYEHPGTKTWKTNLDEAGAIGDFYQGQLVGVLSQSVSDLPVGSPVVRYPLGKVYVKYVIDLYEPQPVNNLPQFLTNPDSGFLEPVEEAESKQSERVTQLESVGVVVPQMRGRSRQVASPATN